MSPRAEYDNGYTVEIPVPSGLYRRYVRIAWTAAGGQVTRCMVALEIEADEVVYQAVRFDNVHGVFHRHLPGFPKPSDERIMLPNLNPNEWLAYAQAEIKRNYQAWERIVLDNVVLSIERDHEKRD